MLLCFLIQLHLNDIQIGAMTMGRRAFTIVCRQTFYYYIVW